MATVTQNKQTQSLCVLRVMMPSKKIRLDRPAITEILVADTDSESGAEASDDDEFYEFEEEEEQQQQQEQEASAQEDKPQAATSGGGSPTWGQPQGRNIKIDPFVAPAKGLKKMRLHTSTKTARHCLC